ncbi:AIPR family protein [Micromonospora sp. AMSO31t]|uniref:AIPR family protein n=2 Tax=unclassified Micromonospora TaxID=2617518 RepID=UPI001788D9B5|nr:AIPR family protein [Micromonospora sp. AMSO31t]
MIDGRDDQGIDAVAVSTPGTAPRLWIVQTKWHERGTAGLKQDEVLKFLRGLNKILDCEYHLFNAKFQAFARDVDAVLSNAAVRITIVVALLGDTEIHPDVRSIIDDEVNKLNFAQPMVDVRVLGLKHFHRAILGDTAEPQINIDARLEGWNLQKDPYEAYYGTISAVDVAGWYEEHGRGLFAKNIRDSLDLTEVNTSITETLLNNPDHFWYFNNGITVLCDSVGKTPKYIPTPGGIGEFSLVGASVVNGAQTVAAIHRAMKQKPETAARGQVIVRLISLEKCPEGFGLEVTQKTNTQNQVESRDFAALDRDQTRLREDFAISLGKTYVIKRGEREPDPDQGCSIVEVAVALACAHRNSELAARAKRDEALLWEGSTYRSIFGKHPNAFRAWRAVLLLRMVRAELESSARDLVGRAAAVATYGDLLIAHIVFQNIDVSALDEPSADWNVQMGRVPSLTASALERVIVAIDDEFGASSQVIATCRSSERSQIVARRVLRDMLSGEKAPTLPSAYRSTSDGRRRLNAVEVLVDSRYIPDGTILEFRPRTKPERAALASWLAADPKRGQASWQNNRASALIWAADGKRYSPTGLVMAMLEMATGTRPKAVQGTSRWYWPGNGSLVELAEKARNEDVPDE